MQKLHCKLCHIFHCFIKNAGINLAYSYVTLPVIIFLLGWVRWYIAVPGTVVLVICYVSLCRSTPVIWRPEWNRKNIEKSILIVGLVFFWVYLSGIGAFVFQNTDHNCRNAIFDSLVNNSWPVVQQVNIDGVISERGLVYYIGYWLPSALAGKAFGLQAGYCFQALWAAAGILLFYYLICAIRKKLSLWPLIVFILFSGLDALGYFLTRTDLSAFTNTLHLEWWSGFQFSGFTTQLFWVFNQAIPAWILTLVMYIQKNNRHLVFLLSLSMLSSTLPFIGMIPIVLCFAFQRQYKTSTTREWRTAFFFDTFSIQNIVGGGIAGILSFLYLRGNISSQNLGIISNTGGMRGYLLLYILFIILEVGVYLLAIYRYQYKNPLYYTIAFWLCLCPLITVGFGKDFCMRASIPALVLLFLLVINSLSAARRSRNYKTCIIIILILVIGSITSIHEINRTIAATSERYRAHVPVLDTNISEEELLKSKNFAGEVDDNFFYRYFSR